MSALCSRVLQQNVPSDDTPAADSKKDISVLSRDTIVKRMRTSAGSMGPSAEARLWHAKTCAELLQYLVRVSSAAAREPHVAKNSKIAEV